eukprot:scaffold4655_cov145-Ochromonas_danica.AAC.1
MAVLFCQPLQSISIAGLKTTLGVCECVCVRERRGWWECCWSSDERGKRESEQFRLIVDFIVWLFPSDNGNQINDDDDGGNGSSVMGLV